MRKTLLAAGLLSLLGSAAAAQERQPLFTMQDTPLLCGDTAEYLRLLEREDFEIVWIGEGPGDLAALYVRSNDGSWMLLTSTSARPDRTCVGGRGLRMRHATAADGARTE
jgi:hypothetical protein